MRDINTPKRSKEVSSEEEKEVTVSPDASRRKPKQKTVVVTLFVVLLTVLVILVTYKYMQAERQVSRLQQNPQQSQAAIGKKVINEVGQIALLPKGTPNVEVVSNVSKLRGQSFYNNAQNGDYILIYSQAQEAILYRPSSNKIIEYTNVAEQ